MFKFDFNVEEDESNALFAEKVVENHANDVSENCLVPTKCYDSQKIVVSSDMMENLDLFKLNSTELIAGDVTVTYMISGILLQMFTLEDDKTTKNIGEAEKNHSDLIPGIYEGGAKIWECTMDLMDYLSKNLSEIFKSKSVLDLGCGSGVLGIYAYKTGAHVHFQDYNHDVLEKFTIPNVLLNIPKPPFEADLKLEKLDNDVQFYSGDWSKYVELTSDGTTFNIILTSETIYNPNNHKKLLNTFYSKLKPNGVVLLAAKTYYFGVGGGIRQFEDLIVRDNRFKSKVLWTSSVGVSREIIEITFK